jgi:hypothetical protein
MPRPPHLTRILCLEGPSAAGKSTLARALEREAGARVVPELDADEAPSIPESAPWFVERHAVQWRRARALAMDASLVVVDGDPFKGLWYNWIFAADGWPAVDVVAPLYRARIAAGELALPDLYVILGATEGQLRERRAGDASRSRRNFERHLLLVAPQRRYFAALASADPSRVLWLDTDDRDVLVDVVLGALGALPSRAPESMHLFDHMVAWIRRHEASGVHGS